MPEWDALSNAMGTSRERRIGSREVEQLLAGDSKTSAYPELSQLLAAAAAPPRRDELVGLGAAVAAFEAAGQDRELSAAVATRRQTFATSFFVKAAAGVAVVLFGGTALAAETGSLPGAAQQQAHDVFSGLGVPPPHADPTSTGSPDRTAAPTPSPNSGNQAEKPELTNAAVLGLCRSWEAQQKNPKTKPMKAKALRVLEAAARGAERIAAFCSPVLAESQGDTPTDSPGTVVTTPSHPGNGKGREKTTPTPNPYKSG